MLGFSVAQRASSAMSLPSDYRPLPSSPSRRRMTVEERRAMEAERSKAVRLCVLIDQEMEVQGLTDPSQIGDVIGLSAMETEKLLTRRRWRAGNLALLEGIAA